VNAIREEGRGLDDIHRLIASWCWRQGWTGLRPVQLKALDAIGATGGRAIPDAIISASTAGGKTEAAFIPLFSRLAERNESGEGRGFDVLYIAPIKALINDQAGRLEELGRDAGIDVTPWHGDAAAGGKAQAMRRPSGCLLITPESLEAMLMRRSRDIGRLFGNLQAIVIDELHAFIGDPRGRQLQSVLHRIDTLNGKSPARIGLSATLSDMRLAADFLRPGTPEAVRIIQTPSDGRTLLLGVKAAVDGDDKKNEPKALDIICADIFERLRGRRNLVFAGSRGVVETIADKLSQECIAQGLPNEFTTHHGNLSKSHRADVEKRMRDEQYPLTPICTSTLELGMDIGPLETVGQVGPAASVSAMRQRLGRSGRRGGKPAILRIWNSLPRTGPGSHPLDLLRLPLIRSIAMCELMLEGWTEPPRPGAIDLSTLLHQTLALIVERHGIKALDAYDILCANGPFRECPKDMYIDLLRSMGRTKLIEQAPEGTLLLAEKGEEMIADRSFFAVFKTPLDWTVIAEGRLIGTIPAEEQLMAPGLAIILAGRRWKVEIIDDKRREVFVKPSRAGKAPKFSGEPGAIHREIPRRMRRFLERTDLPAFLDPVARNEVEEARALFRDLEHANIQLIYWDGSTTILPWDGTIETNTLAMRLSVESRFEVQSSQHAIEVAGVGPNDVRGELDRIAMGQGLKPCEDLAIKASDLIRAKFDGWIHPELLAKAYAVSRLDAAWRPS
jgi:ATP-dependent Lhr-like helicase